MDRPRTRRRVRPNVAPTITEVAARAGVSTATVSRVFAESARVSSELRQRVHQAARHLGYQPSRVARSLRLGSTLTVGVIIPDLQNPFFTAVVRGIDNSLQAAGYTLLLANSDEVPAREERMLATFRAEGVAGLIFVPIAAHRGEYRHLLHPPLPVVAIDRLPPGIRVDLVTVDNIDASRRAVAHLLALGHRRVGLVAGPERHSTAHDRHEGYAKALADAGLPVQPDLVAPGDFREAGGYAAMLALLDRPDPPRAVFVANNLMTEGALRAIVERRRRIPDDVALVCFDDLPWATVIDPPLTAVAQPAHEIGAAAAELLLARIAEPDRPVRHVVLETTLIVRASCGAVPRQRPLRSLIL